MVKQYHMIIFIYLRPINAHTAAVSCNIIDVVFRRIPHLFEGEGVSH